MRRSRIWLTSILGVAIGAAACSQSPTAPPEAQQARVLPALSLFKVTSQPAASHGDSEDHNDHNDGEHGQGSAQPPVSSLVSCTPLRHDSRSKDIDEKGGSLDIGPHTLVIPAGALLKKTRITAEIVSDNVNSIKFSPEGLQFLTPTYLFMSYANCSPGTMSLLEVVYTNDDMSQVIQNQPSFDDLPENTVVALLNHFSRYAVAY